MSKAFVFDFDDTLVITDCKVRVRNLDDVELQSLTPAQYSAYTLGPDEYFDYEEFRDPRFIEKAEKLVTMELAKEVHDEDHDVFILTARGSAVADAIDSFLIGYGIDAKQIHCLGDTSTNDNMASEKAKVLGTLAMAYDKLYFYDDNKQNIEHARAMGIKSYQIKRELA
tara:strand:+ start:193 stop:699 length:507 start_codon:yes stop_codon:yes gene_type:complete